MSPLWSRLKDVTRPSWHNTSLGTGHSNKPVRKGEVYTVESQNRETVYIQQSDSNLRGVHTFLSQNDIDLLKGVGTATPDGGRDDAFRKLVSSRVYQHDSTRSLDESEPDHSKSEIDSIQEQGTKETQVDQKGAMEISFSLQRGTNILTGSVESDSQVESIDDLARRSSIPVPEWKIHVPTLPTVPTTASIEFDFDAIKQNIRTPRKQVEVRPMAQAKSVVTVPVEDTNVYEDISSWYPKLLQFADTLEILSTPESGVQLLQIRKGHGFAANTAVSMGSGGAACEHSVPSPINPARSGVMAFRDQDSAGTHINIVEDLTLCPMSVSSGRSSRISTTPSMMERSIAQDYLATHAAVAPEPVVDLTHTSTPSIPNLPGTEVVDPDMPLLPGVNQTDTPVTPSVRPRNNNLGFRGVTYQHHHNFLPVSPAPTFMSFGSDVTADQTFSVLRKRRNNGEI